VRVQGLSFDQMPEMDIPFRFFLTAPWMGVAAALVLLTGGWLLPLPQEWSPRFLASTHLITLGFMTMVMMGALFQLLPVITGQRIPCTRMVATLSHLALLTGASLLAVAFLAELSWIFLLAMSLLFVAIFPFVAALLYLFVLLHRNGAVQGDKSLFAIRLAVLSLLFTLLFGLLRALVHAGYPLLDLLQDQAYIHLSWGMFGWIMLLVMGVSYQVIPMFHVTPEYPEKLARAFPLLVFVALLLLTFVRSGPVYWISLAGLFISLNGYVWQSLRLLGRKKRKTRDVTVDFWRFALVCASVASLLFLVGLSTAGGVLFLYGFGCSVMIGMLQKIVPFLLYMHMQKGCRGDLARLTQLPNMHQILPVRRSSCQLVIHGVATGLLVLAVMLPLPVFLVALALLLDFLWLGASLVSAFLLYRRAARADD
jgi:hypothetical protein